MDRVAAALAVLLVQSSAAWSGEFVYYDTKTYCEKVAASIGGSYTIQEACREQEKAAKQRLLSTDRPEDLMKICTPVSEVEGGSYTILETCLQQEAQAKANLK